MGFDKENLIKKSVPLVGFSGEIAHSVGEITIPTYIDGVSKLVRYLVIEGPTTYNVILGRPWLNQMKAVPSTYHQCLKFPTQWGTVTVKGDREESRKCYAQALKATTKLPHSNYRTGAPRQNTRSLPRRNWTRYTRTRNTRIGQY
ncbi:uncharacterized protein LOC141632272 [Silene latifolia]|uniref:uncharacterized protein LOC141632272 n=1 Tax=Silene latifolia TaxID=37657 RepID=UPI003D783305